MKIPKSQLKQIIVEEVENLFIEEFSIDAMKARQQGRASDVDYQSPAEKDVIDMSSKQFDEMMKQEDEMPTGIGTEFSYPSKKMSASRRHPKGKDQASVKYQRWFKSANEEKRLELFRTVLRMHGYERWTTMMTNFLVGRIQTFSSNAKGSSVKTLQGREHADFRSSNMAMFKIKDAYYVNVKKYPKVAATLQKAGFKPNAEGVIVSPEYISVNRQFHDSGAHLKPGASGGRQALATLQKDYGFERDKPGESPFIKREGLMKITKSQLKQIIKEELESVLSEGPLTKGMDFKMDPRLAKDAERLSKQPRDSTPRQLSPEEKTIKMYQKQGYKLIKKQLSNREFGDSLRLDRGDRELIDVSEQPPRFIIVVDKEIGPAGKFRPTRYRPQNFPDGFVNGGRVSGTSFGEAKIVTVLSRG